MPGNLALTSSTPTGTHMLQDHRRRRTWPTAAAWWGACFPLDSERHSSAPPPRGCIRDLTNCPSRRLRRVPAGRASKVETEHLLGASVQQCQYRVATMDSSLQQRETGQLSPVSVRASPAVCITSPLTCSAPIRLQSLSLLHESGELQQQADAKLDPSSVLIRIWTFIWLILLWTMAFILWPVGTGSQSSAMLCCCAHNGSCILGSRTRASGLKSAAAAAAG